MAKKKLSAHDKHVEEVQKFDWCAYVKTKEPKTVGVYSSPDKMLAANNNASLKKLKNTFKYGIQLVIE